ncbi:MAG: hypothetical protein ACK52I_29040 [Pseudomonadota bacterium]
MRKLIKEICKREGKKSQVAIGDVREVLAVMMDIWAEELNSEEDRLSYSKEIQDALNKRLKKLEARLKKK